MTRSYAEDGRRPEPKPRIDLTDTALIMITVLFLTANQRATHRIRTKALQLLEYVDEALYADSAAITASLSLARAVARAVMRHNARNLTAVEHWVMDDTDWTEEYSAFFTAHRQGLGHHCDGGVVKSELSDEEVAWVDDFVSTRLRYSHLWGVRGAFREIADRIDAGDLGKVSDFNEVVHTTLERFLQRSRSSRATGDLSSLDFRTGDPSFEATIRAAHTIRNQPQATVKTGVRLLNDMLGGGYQGGRVYVHFGRSGDWKSGMLCSAAFWATDPRFNPEYRTKDPTRHPVVLFITQENDPVETIERMVSYGVGSDVDLSGSDVDQMVAKLCDVYSTESCKFSFKYRQSRSITTADVDAMIEDEYLDGNEVVMVIHDYIKRIKSVEQFRDQRHLELGAIVDEFSSIAKRRGVPFVTGMQLNREAYSRVEAALKAGKTDGVKELGASQVGESINVFENADVVIFQSRVFMESVGKMYLTVRRAKMRGKRRGGPDYFAQPFAADDGGEINEMLLAQDAHLSERECLGRKEIADDVAEDYDPNAPPGGQTREERRNSRAGAALGIPPPSPQGGGGGVAPQPTRRAPSGPTRRPAVPTTGVATLTQIPEPPAEGPPAADPLSGLGASDLPF